MSKAADYEIWKLSQAHREGMASSETREADRPLVPLILSLARLAAQRQIRGAAPIIEVRPHDR